MSPHTSAKTHTGDQQSFDRLIRYLDTLRIMTDHPISDMQRMLFRFSASLIERPDEIPRDAEYPMLLISLYDLLDAIQDIR